MLDLSKDIDSLSNFKRKTAAFLKRMRSTGHPIVLTVNGKASFVVQDAAAYQRLLERAELAETVALIQKGREDIRSGKIRPMREAVEQLGKK